QLDQRPELKCLATIRLNLFRGGHGCHEVGHQRVPRCSVRVPSQYGTECPAVWRTRTTQGPRKRFWGERRWARQNPRAVVEPQENLFLFRLRTFPNSGQCQYPGCEHPFVQTATSSLERLGGK